jgi:hypothetical protein
LALVDVAQKPETANSRDIAFAVGIVVMLTILFLPVPVFLIDFGLALSLAFSVLILMVALWIQAARFLVLPDDSADRHDVAPFAQHRHDPHDPVGGPVTVRRRRGTSSADSRASS